MNILQELISEKDNLHKNNIELQKTHAEENSNRIIGKRVHTKILSYFSQTIFCLGELLIYLNGGGGVIQRCTHLFFLKKRKRGSVK